MSLRRFVEPSNPSVEDGTCQMILIDQQSDDKQPINLTHALVNINKATYLPPVDIEDDRRWHYMEIKGRSTELVGGRVIEDTYNARA